MRFENFKNQNRETGFSVLMSYDEVENLKLSQEEAIEIGNLLSGRMSISDRVKGMLIIIENLEAKNVENDVQESV